MTTSTEQTVKKSKMGGARKGAGRPQGSTQEITIGILLDKVRQRTNGKNYEELLVEDFIKARDSDDKNLTVKYHNLILNKVMNSIAKIEVNDTSDNVEMKQLAFAEALAKLTEKKK
jgi:hypothetical protein